MTTPTWVRGELSDLVPFDAELLARMRAACKVVAIGVLAHVIDQPEHLEVRAVMATDPRHPGAVGSWLDRLPRDRMVVVPAVVSDRLARMLERRGFRADRWWDPALGVFDDGAMIRHKESS